MPEARLATHVWVAAYRRRLDLLNIPVYVAAHGDDTAGAVLVKLCPLDGTARAFTRQFDLASETRHWTELASGPEAEIDALVARQRMTDPDLWVIEVEDRAGRHLLNEDGL